MGNTGDGLNLPVETVQQVGGLTAEQRAANFALVQARLGVDEYENPNTADTPAHLSEHELFFKRTRSDQVGG